MSTYRPIIVVGGNATPLENVRLSQGHKDGFSYDERWLQDLIQSHPAILPTGEIEPGFGALIPVATEVYCGHGYIDNLFVTANGGLCIVETKLWRNPEARREVVAQVLDYAAALAGMTYADLERALLEAMHQEGEVLPKSLYALVADQADALEEDRFVDAVSGNLRKGRMLVIVAGDGMRSETEALAGLLQSHAGARFTFALVAIELFRHGGTSAILAVPRTIAKTVLIERGVVRVEDGKAIVVPPPKDAPNPKPQSMTEEVFMEAMAARGGQLPAALRLFLERISAFDVNPDWRASLNLKWRGGPDGPVNLGYIALEGTYSTHTINNRTSPAIAERFLQDIAAIVGGSVKQSGFGQFVVGADGRVLLIEELLPEHADAWANAMRRCVDSLKAAAIAEE